MSIRIDSLTNVTTPPNERGGYGPIFTHQTGCLRNLRQADLSVCPIGSEENPHHNRLSKIERYDRVDIFLEGVGDVVTHREFTSIEDVDPKRHSTVLDFGVDFLIDGRQMEGGRMIIETIDEKRQVDVYGYEETGIYGILEFKSPDAEGKYRMVIDLDTQYKANGITFAKHYPPYGQAHRYDKFRTGGSPFAQFRRLFVAKHQGNGDYETTFEHVNSFYPTIDSVHIIDQAGKHEVSHDMFKPVEFTHASEHSPFYGENRFYLTENNQRFGVENPTRGEKWEFPIDPTKQLQQFPSIPRLPYSGCNIEDAMNAGYQRLNQALELFDMSFDAKGGMVVKLQS